MVFRFHGMFLIVHVDFLLKWSIVFYYKYNLIYTRKYEKADQFFVDCEKVALFSTTATNHHSQW